MSSDTITIISRGAFVCLTQFFIIIPVFGWGWFQIDKFSEDITWRKILAYLILLLFLISIYYTVTSSIGECFRAFLDTMRGTSPASLEITKDKLNNDILNIGIIDSIAAFVFVLLTGSLTGSLYVSLLPTIPAVIGTFLFPLQNIRKYWLMIGIILIGIFLLWGLEWYKNSNPQRARRVSNIFPINASKLPSYHNYLCVVVFFSIVAVLFSYFISR